MDFASSIFKGGAARQPNSPKISKGTLHQHNNIAMADYKSYLAASILTEDKLVTIHILDIITTTDGSFR